VPLGEDGFYGMGLMGQKTADVQWYHHGGDLIGYHSDLYFIPGPRSARCWLTNTDSGAAMRGPFIRRLLELLYDGKPEAEETVKASAAAIKAAVIAERKQLVYPADPKIASGLASRYTSEDLGSMVFTRSPRGLSGSNGVWSINFATRPIPMARSLSSRPAQDHGFGLCSCQRRRQASFGGARRPARLSLHRNSVMRLKNSS